VIVLPSWDLTKYLYWNVLPVGKLIEAYHNGLLLVYCVALSAMADEIDQEPSCGMLPKM
jgi:hypothetical protein